MARHVSTPELRRHQWQRKKEEEQKATRERQEIRELYDIKMIQGVLRAQGVKKAIKQAGMVWGSPNFYEGYWIDLFTDGPLIGFHDVGLDVFLECVRHLREAGIAIRRVYEGNKTGKGRIPTIFLQDLS